MKLRWKLFIAFFVLMIFTEISSFGIVRQSIYTSIFLIVLYLVLIIFALIWGCNPKMIKPSSNLRYNPIFSFRTKDFIVVSKENFEKYETFIDNIDEQRSTLKKEIEQEKSNFEKIKAENIEEINNSKVELEIEFNSVKAENQKKLDTLNEKIELLEVTLRELEENINSIDCDYTKELVISEKDYDGITSEETLKKIKFLDLKEKDMISNDEVVFSYNYDRSKKETKAQIRQILRSFISESDLIIEKVNATNYESSLHKLFSLFNSLNKIYEIDEVEISRKFLDLKVDKLVAMNQYRQKKEHEREQQKAIKEQMKEEERVRREIESEKRKIEKESSQFNKELNRVMEYMAKSDSDIEKKFYIEKIQELEAKIKQLEKDKENVLEREANTRAGFVYIISNIGSFGNDVFKIGMTRRLEPMDRIKELSSASVPFEFDVHAMIFSDNAPSLENAIHNKFRDKAVNKANDRKEFFRIPLSEIKDFVNNEFGLTVEFTELAKAEEYYRTLDIENKIKSS